MMGTIKITKTMTTETAHRLVNYVGKCASIHGHSYLWEVECECLEGLDTRGMVIDFGDLKAAMKKHIYDVYDHALVLAKTDPLMSRGDFLRAIIDDASGGPQKLVEFPTNPTAENFAQTVAELLQAELEDIHLDEGTYRITRVRVWETANSYAEWTPENDLFPIEVLSSTEGGEADN